jgi:hypothetical protein
MLYSNQLKRNIWGAVLLRLYPWNLMQLKLSQGNVANFRRAPDHFLLVGFFCLFVHPPFVS